MGSPERQTETDRQRDRDRQAETDGQRERDRENKRDTDREIERQTDRQTDRQRIKRSTDLRCDIKERSARTADLVVISELIHAKSKVTQPNEAGRVQQNIVHFKVPATTSHAHAGTRH